MRLGVPAFLRALALVAGLCATPALAAPTCQTVNGDTVRCGTSGAMPVGWTLSPQDFAARQSTPAQDPNRLWEAFCVLGVFFALMAMVPEFDGRTDREWGGQEDDSDKRG